MQAITPLFSIVPNVVMITADVLEMHLGPITAHLSIGMTIITLANPITAIYFIRPYREGLLEMLRIRKQVKVGPSTTMMCGVLSVETSIYY